MKQWRMMTALAALLVGGGALRADEQSEMQAVIEKAIKAHGGAEALTGSPAITIKASGKYYGMGEGLPYTMTIYAQQPDKTRVEIDVEVMGKTFRVLQVFNGDKGWTGFDGNYMELSKEAIAVIREQRYEQEVTRLAPLRDKAYQLSSLGEAKVEGKPAVGVLVKRQGHKDVNLYFDKENGLLLKSETRARDVANPDAEFTQETFYGDYRKIAGRMAAHKSIAKRDGKLFLENEISSFMPVTEHDNSLFAKP
jgi:hypothetical protein